MSINNKYFKNKIISRYKQNLEEPTSTVCTCVLKVYYMYTICIQEYITHHKINYGLKNVKFFLFIVHIKL
jgi:hypothetical protein